MSAPVPLARIVPRAVRAGYGCAGDGLHDNVAEGKTNKAEIQCLKKISATGKSRKRILPPETLRAAGAPRR